MSGTADECGFCGDDGPSPGMTVHANTSAGYASQQVWLFALFLIGSLWAVLLHRRIAASHTGTLSSRVFRMIRTSGAFLGGWVYVGVYYTSMVVIAVGRSSRSSDESRHSPASLPTTPNSGTIRK
jgi:hypothetical protein